jgi:hypothetical protein
VRSPSLKLVLPSYPFRLVHLVTVWAYGASQPVFSMLDANPEFLVVRGSTRLEVVVFALALAIVPPLLAVLCAWLVSLASRGLGDAMYLLFLGLFIAPFALLLLKSLHPRAATAVIGAAWIAVIFVTAYVRWRHLRSFLTLSAVLPVAGFALFAIGIPLVVDDVAGARVRVPSEAPVIVLVLDELPTSSLLTTSGNIDPVRYPNFARLAGASTWYPRTTSVYEETTGAMPAMLTGRLPEGPQLQTLARHPQNLFTLLGESYRLRVQESVTYLCPKRYCPRDRQPLRERVEGLVNDVRIAYLHLMLPDSLKGGVPEIGERWGDLNRERLLAAEDVDDAVTVEHNRRQDHERQFGQFLAAMSRTGSAKTLHFIHLALPHSPWQFLPTGHRYAGEFALEGKRDGVWTAQPWPVDTNYQRHLLQVGFTDRLVGQLLRRLDALRIFDRAMIVVVADQGANFVPGQSNRTVTRDNLADLARVPLFVKAPGQKTARIDRRPVQTIDILPTIADVLGVQIPWSVDGHSLFEPGRETADVRVGKRDGSFVTAPSEEVDRLMAATVRRKTRLFGSGSDSLYDRGSSRELLGRPIRELPTVASEDVRVRFDYQQSFAHIDRSSYVPARLIGTMSGLEGSARRVIVVAVNGRVAALGETYRLDGRLRFSALIPPSSFRDGFNTVELFLLDGPKASPQFVGLTWSDR